MSSASHRARISAPRDDEDVAVAAEAEARLSHVSEDTTDHITDARGRPLGCDVCKHAVWRFNSGNGATTCNLLKSRVVAVGVNKPNFRPIGCPLNGGR